MLESQLVFCVLVSLHFFCDLNHYGSLMVNVKFCVESASMAHDLGNSPNPN